MGTDKERLASLEAGAKFIFWFISIAATIFVGVLIWYGTELFSMQGRISSIETSIVTINKSLDELRLVETASSPTTPSSASEATKILTHAQEKQIKFSPAVVESTGLRFIDAGQISSDAWKTAQEYLGYRSFLNAGYQPTFGDITPSQNSTYHFSLNMKPSKPDHTLFATVYNAGPKASGKDDARLESLSAGIQTTGSGAKWLIVDLKSADPMILDDEYMRNVIVRNGRVEYDGGPLLLINVYFVNCKFNFVLKPRAVDLSKVMLASAAVNFGGENKSALLLSPSVTNDTGIRKKHISPRKPKGALE